MAGTIPGGLYRTAPEADTYVNANGEPVDLADLDAEALKALGLKAPKKAAAPKADAAE